MYKKIGKFWAIHYHRKKSSIPFYSAACIVSLTQMCYIFLALCIIGRYYSLYRFSFLEANAVSWKIGGALVGLTWIFLNYVMIRKTFKSVDSNFFNQETEVLTKKNYLFYLMIMIVPFILAILILNRVI
jgi:hypothetical protein